PPGGPDRAGEVAGRAQVAGTVDRERELRQRAARGAEEHRAAARGVEGGVVAWTDERRLRLRGLEGRRAVEGDRAAGVRADLRVGEDAVRRPARAAVGQAQGELR